MIYSSSLIHLFDFLSLTSTIFDWTLRESHQTANDKATTSKIRRKINSLLQSTILTPQIGGMTSISQEPSEIIQQDRMPESSMRNSSKPGGRGSG